MKIFGRDKLVEVERGGENFENALVVFKVISPYTSVIVSEKSMKTFCVFRPDIPTRQMSFIHDVDRSKYIYLVVRPCTK